MVISQILVKAKEMGGQEKGQRVKSVARLSLSGCPSHHYHATGLKDSSPSSTCNPTSESCYSSHMHHVYMKLPITADSVLLQQTINACEALTLASNISLCYSDLPQHLSCLSYEPIMLDSTSASRSGHKNRGPDQTKLKLELVLQNHQSWFNQVF